MSFTNRIDIEELDVEWVNLILTARHLGLSTDDVRSFLRGPALPVQTVHSHVENEHL